MKNQQQRKEVNESVSSLCLEIDEQIESQSKQPY